MTFCVFLRETGAVFENWNDGLKYEILRAKSKFRSKNRSSCGINGRMRVFLSIGKCRGVIQYRLIKGDVR